MKCHSEQNGLLSPLAITSLQASFLSNLDADCREPATMLPCCASSLLKAANSLSYSLSSPCSEHMPLSDLASHVLVSKHC